jgi:hypothetical protein
MTISCALRFRAQKAQHDFPQNKNISPIPNSPERFPKRFRAPTRSARPLKGGAFFRPLDVLFENQIRDQRFR